MLGMDAAVSGLGHRQVVEAGPGGLVVRFGTVEKRPVGAWPQARQQRRDRRFDIRDETDLDRHAPPDRLRTDVDLNHPRFFRIEMAVGKVAAEHDQGIAIEHRLIA